MACTSSSTEPYFNAGYIVKMSWSQVFFGCSVGIFNFTERARDKKGGPRFTHKELPAWLEFRDLFLGVGDPWILKKDVGSKPCPGIYLV